ncbi:MAG: hypothetical protein PHR35_04135 [Kiritimatiellae bacterium]|nr:hypothetical protein [Kiritimatiellia bacterium]
MNKRLSPCHMLAWGNWLILVIMVVVWWWWLCHFDFDQYLHATVPSDGVCEICGACGDDMVGPCACEKETP